MNKKRILVAPLDWGLGHAARCVPIIRYLLERGAEVIIAADKGPLALLREEFPQLEVVVLPGYDIRYAKSGRAMPLKMLLSVPGILAKIRKEHEALKQIIQENAIDAVISDNRYGLWTKEVPCVFITHQLRIKTPVGESRLQKINYKYIEKYTECWIPDYAGEPNLSGELSHGFALPPNTCYIGPLSRLQKQNAGTRHYHTMAILSGPEPQRTIFEKILLKQLKASSLKALLVRGLAGNEDTIQGAASLEIKNHINATEMAKAIASSGTIICRSGYSSIMDLAATGGKAIFIPTPGQTEQEYLAKHFKEKGIVFSSAQDHFDLDSALRESLLYKGFDAKLPIAFRGHVDRLLGMI